MYKIMLNNKKPYNYAFFDPETRIHLTLATPVAEVDGCSKAIYRAILSGTLIDIDGMLKNANEKSSTKSKSEPKKTEQPKKVDSPAPVEQPVVPEVKEEVPEEPKDFEQKMVPPVDNGDVQEEKTTTKKTTRGKSKKQA